MGVAAPETGARVLGRGNGVLVTGVRVRLTVVLVPVICMRVLIRYYCVPVTGDYTPARDDSAAVKLNKFHEYVNFDSANPANCAVIATRSSDQGDWRPDALGHTCGVERGRTDGQGTRTTPTPLADAHVQTTGGTAARRGGGDWTRTPLPDFTAIYCFDGQAARGLRPLPAAPGGSGCAIAAVNTPQSKRFAKFGDVWESRQRLECGDFSTALSQAIHGQCQGRCFELFTPTHFGQLQNVTSASNTPSNSEPLAPGTFKLPTGRLADLKSQLPSKDWPHAPVHRLVDNAVYFVTASTLHKQHLFDAPEKRDLLKIICRRVFHHRRHTAQATPI